MHLRNNWIFLCIFAIYIKGYYYGKGSLQEHDIRL